MTEDERHVSFDEQALGKVLGTRPATVRDVAYGEGQLFSAGHGAARLEVFSRSGVTRLTAADMRVELFRNADASVSQTGVEFHRSQPDQEASLTVLPGGGVVFTFVAGSEPTSESLTGAEISHQSEHTDRNSARVHEPPAEPTPDATNPPVPPPTGEAPASPPTGRAEPSPAPPRTASPAAGDAAPESRQPGSEPRQTRPEQAPRVQLTGRLGRDPSFRTTTKTGTLVGRFPLAEHLDDGQTRWHTVLTFGDRAKQLERRTQVGELAQGREVDVVGYLHTTTRPGKDGRPRPVQEIYATAVTRH